MRSVAILIGPDSDSPNVTGPENGAVSIRIATDAAVCLASSHGQVLLMGDAVSVLGVGSGLMGYQDGRTVEGGERRSSPLRVLPLLRSGNAEIDRSLSFEEVSDDLTRSSEDADDAREDNFGSLSELVNLGLLDLVDGARSLHPVSSEQAAETVMGYFESERPEKILVIGRLNKEILDKVVSYAESYSRPIARVKRWPHEELPSGVKSIACEPVPPFLDGLQMMFSDGDVSEGGEGVLRVVDEELMYEAKLAAWEAGVALNVIEWLEMESLPRGIPLCSQRYVRIVLAATRTL